MRHIIQNNDMDTLLKIRLLLLRLSVSILFLFAVGKLTADVSNQVDTVIYSVQNKMWKIEGAATNGISGDLSIMCGGLSRAWITVYLKRQGDQLLPEGTNCPVYWEATNSFCGPIRLIDANSNQVTSLKPIYSLPTSYPASLSMRQINEDFGRQLIKYKYILAFPKVPGYPGRDFLRDPNRDYQLTAFNLSDYFKPEKAGEYKLTVWPKIYKQSETNKDIYDRIDVPSIIVTIKWE